MKSALVVLLTLVAVIAFASVSRAGPIRDRIRARLNPQPYVAVPNTPTQRPAVVTIPPAAYRPSDTPAISPYGVRLSVPACTTGNCPLKR